MADEDEKEERRKKQAEELALSSIGIQLAVSIGIGAWVGLWLDKRNNSAPVYTLIFTFIGFLAGFWNVYQLVSRKDKKK